jgi:hypothetical protein
MPRRLRFVEIQLGLCRLSNGLRGRRLIARKLGHYQHPALDHVGGQGEAVVMPTGRRSRAVRSTAKSCPAEKSACAQVDSP